MIPLAACAPRAQIFVDRDLTPPASVRPIFIGTTRAVDPVSAYGNERSETVSYARFDFSVPPNREAGSVPFPLDEVNAAEQFIATRAGRYASPQAFSADLRRALAERTGADREAIIFVHGFNNTFAEGTLRLAQLATDFGFQGVAVHYSWASGGNALAYAYDRDSALFARDGLEKLIEQVEAAGARRIVIVGHSMGSLIVMETLRQMSIARPGSVDDRIGGAILISPDLDIDVFRSQARRIEDLPDPFGIFVSKRDRALQLSARLTGQRNRLGNIASAEEIEEFDVTLVDVTEFSRGAGHFTAATSPALISLFSAAGNIEAAFQGDSAGRTGFFPGTILTVQSATEIILSPVTALASQN
ncbi:alpha/beta hydrolase [Anianabacter salinae]|uniref:alpha/beta hydrolase n=1 Tax=Anianabacter salinae TaxID=2851023 RepID=UPI00225E30D9|nr:alpha/beta fold hydrolase [Anianabacter salinae]MBV0913502.1 alpha/beta fold hydrolase [Anianabacter salinae]